MIIGFWNINTIRNKLENDTVLQWIHQNDIVVLGEIKVAKLPHIPGFVPIIAKTVNTRRGGLAVLIKNYLYPDVYHIDRTVNDQIWFSLSSAPQVRFCGAYITPSTSSYFDEAEMANIQAKTVEDEMVIIVGDLNSRLGEKVHDLVGGVWTYNPVDVGENENGKKLFNICKDNNLVVANNLKTESATLTSSLTYRMRNKWVSELDLCIVSKKLAPALTHFHVNQDTSLPSNHAPVSVTFNSPERSIGLHELVTRSEDIGTYPSRAKSLCKAPIRYHQINQELFKETIAQFNPPPLDYTDVNVTANNFSSQLYHITKMCKLPRAPDLPQDACKRRWERIMACEDDNLLWKAIDWKGQFDPTNVSNDTQPTEPQFRKHLEDLLNPPTECEQLDLSNYNVSVPILDKKIEVKEVKDVKEKQVKPDKSCGPDGNSPGVFKLLPDAWIYFICMLLNVVFIAGYPMAWSVAKLIMLFKKGARLDCNNYRGISIMDAIAKIYDYVLNNRLILWYKVCREQAGAQTLRGCIEHIVTLRLIIEVFLRKRKKLFIVFVDFRKAYDLVPRNRLFQILINLGCGATMLAALMAIYQDTSCILGSTIITSTIGVRQGSPTSCYLFVIFVDVLILMFKSRCVPEPIIQWLHVLMLMDDTIIFATSREKVQEKLDILNEYCKANGMQVNESKTKFMAINGSPMDKVSFMMGTHRVRHCDSYLYLGVPITADGHNDSTLKMHLDNKNKEVNKLIIFLAANYDAPFTVKKRVVEAAFMSSILYGCESWLNISLKPAEKVYNSAIKALLGVRPSATNDLCIIEGGFKPLAGLVKDRQKKFFEKMASRSYHHEDPFTHAMEMVNEMHKPMKTYIDSIKKGGEFATKELQKIKDSATHATGTKFKTYLQLNPDLTEHKLYSRDAPIIPDYLRITFSRYRLSSHRLRVEIWRYKGVPHDQRVCACGLGVQDEHHIFLCPRVEELLRSPNKTYNSPSDIFNEATVEDLHVLHKVLKELDGNNE